MPWNLPRGRSLAGLGACALILGISVAPGAAASASTSPLQIPPVVDPPPLVIPIPAPTPAATPTPAAVLPIPVPAGPALPPAQPATAVPAAGPAGATASPPAGSAATPESAAPPAQIARPEDYKPSLQEALDLPGNLDRLYFEGQQLILSNEFAQMEHDFGLPALRAGGGAGSFGSPLLANRQIIITQLFGCTEFDLEPYNPGCGSRHWHTGTDWAAPAGMPVFAADAGVVRLFRDPKGYGNHAVIVHGNGFVSLYGHLQGFAVEDGQVVRRGDMIGQVGSSGFSTGSHLHFEIRHDNVYLDPCVYLGCTG